MYDKLEFALPFLFFCYLIHFAAYNIFPGNHKKEKVYSVTGGAIAYGSVMYVPIALILTVFYVDSFYTLLSNVFMAVYFSFVYIVTEKFVPNYSLSVFVHMISLFIFIAGFIIFK